MPVMFKSGKRYVFWNDGSVEIISVAKFRQDLIDDRYGECVTAFTYGNAQVISYKKCDVQFAKDEAK